MANLKRFFDFYINSSIHIAIAVFSLVQISKLSLNIDANIELEIFLLFGTILGYNFLKYFQVFWNRVYNFKKNYSIFLVSSVSFLVMIYYYFQLSLDYKLEFLKIAILILIYPFIRKYPFLKMAFVSFCLTYITVYLLIIEQKINYIYLIQRFLMLFCLLIPFEICDIALDSKTIKTLPQIIGIKNVKTVGYCFLILFLCLNYNLSNIFFAIFTAIAIFLSNENRSKYFTSFWVESLPIFWWVLVIVLE